MSFGSMLETMGYFTSSKTGVVGWHTVRHLRHQQIHYRHWRRSSLRQVLQVLTEIFWAAYTVDGVTPPGLR